MHTSDVRPAKDLVMGLSAHDQTFALRVDLKEITELSGVKKQAGAELYPKLSKKFKKVRKSVKNTKFLENWLQTRLQTRLQMK